MIASHMLRPMVWLQCGLLAQQAGSTDAAVLAARLEGHGIIASARGTGLRVSFHAYNNDQDVDAVLEALEKERTLICRAGDFAEPT